MKRPERSAPWQLDDFDLGSFWAVEKFSASAGTSQSKGSVNMLEFSAALSSAKATLEIAKVAIDARDHAKISTAVFELKEKLSAMGDTAFALTERNAVLQAKLADLEAENRKLKAAEEERDRYRLVKLGNLGVAHAYQLRPAGELAGRTDEDDHYLCQPCFDAGKKAVLSVGPYTAHCPVCRHAWDVARRPPAQASRSGVY